MNVVGTRIKRRGMAVIFVEDFQFPLDICLVDDKLEGAVVCS
jgi:hypothetical protein